MRKALSVRRVPGDRKLCQGAPAEMRLPQTRTHGTRGPLREPEAPRLSHGTPTLTNPDSHPDAATVQERTANSRGISEGEVRAAKA